MSSTTALSVLLVCLTSAASAQRTSASADLERRAAPGGVERALTPPSFSKVFERSLIGPGSTTRLTFTVVNPDAAPADNVAFTDVLPAGMVLATPANASTTFAEGTLTAPDGGTTISYAGGRLAASATETVAVDVIGVDPGALLNVSGDLTSSAGNSGTAMATLTVDATLPGFSKSFSPSTIPFGGVSTLTFTIDNTANLLPVDQLTFTDLLPAGMVVAAPSNATVSCQGGVFPPFLTATPGTNQVFLQFGFVPAQASCTVSVDVTSSIAGTHLNTTTELLSGVLSAPSGFATAALVVEPPGAGGFTKSFVNDPVLPGGTVDLRYTIVNFDRSNTLTGITFTDDLDGALSGLVALGLPAGNVCGPGSMLSGTSVLTLTGGTLAPQTSCTFDVTLQVPAGAQPGSYASSTSPLTAAGSVTIGAATDTLRVETAPLLTKAFPGGTTVAGGTVQLEFSIANTSSTSSATNISFSDDLDAFLSGLVVSGLPAPGFCGAGSNLTLTIDPQVLILTGGSLAPGASCTFDVTLQVAGGSSIGTHRNTTSILTADLDGAPVAGPAASADLDIVQAPVLAKAFTDDPVVPGNTVTLQYTLAYPTEVGAVATDIAFTDDLDGALSGLAASGLPMFGVCGPGSVLSGTTQLSLTGGTLTPGSSCTFSVPVQVPASVLPGQYLSTTSPVTSTLGSFSATELPASDTLRIGGVGLSKAFLDQPVQTRRTVQLEYTVTNEHPTLPVTNFSFSDDLDGALHGLIAVGLPANGICGPGSTLTGEKLLSFQGGSLAPQTTCTFQVTLHLYPRTPSGEYRSVATQVVASLGGNSVPLDDAEATLIVATPPGDPPGTGGGPTGPPVSDRRGTENDAPNIAITQILSAQAAQELGATLSRPTAIAVDRSGRAVYVAGLASDNVFQIADPGLPTQTLREILRGSTTDGGPRLSGPSALVVDERGTLYVAGGASHNVLRITDPGLPEQSVEEILDARGAGPGMPLRQPQAMALDPRGNLYVSGRASDNVLEVTPEGRKLELIGALGDGDGHALAGPAGIAVNSDGTVYVAGEGSQNVFALTPEGSVREVLAAGLVTPIPFAGPVGIATDTAGALYLTGFASDNVLRILDPGLVTQAIEVLLDASGDGHANLLAGPACVDVDAAGNVYVAGTHSSNAFRVTSQGTVAAITRETGGARVVIEDVAGLALGHPHLYVTSRETDRVYRITTDAAAASYRNAGSILSSYQAERPVVGELWTASVDLTRTGHTHAMIQGHATPASTAFGERTLLVGGARILQLPLRAGPVAHWSARIPDDSSLAGLAIYTQAVHVSGAMPFVLSNAQDLLVGH